MQLKAVEISNSKWYIGRVEDDKPLFLVVDKSDKYNIYEGYSLDQKNTLPLFTCYTWGEVMTLCEKHLKTKKSEVVKGDKKQ